jgi:LPXTG-motif cell wall-anchored protein
MKLARRLIIGSSLAVGSLAIVPGIAGAAASNCVTPGTMNEPTCVVTPTVAGSATSTPSASALPNTGSPSSGAGAPAGTATTTSLPFTGADVEELAVVGVGAVLAGGLLLRRRRRPIS